MPVMHSPCFQGLQPPINFLRIGSRPQSRPLIVGGLYAGAKRPSYAESVPLEQKVGQGVSALLIATFLVGVQASLPETFSQQAVADDESSLSPYERRRLDLERRRELLRKAREDALNKVAPADTPAEPEALPAPEEPKAFEGFSFDAPSLYQQKSSSAPTLQAEPKPAPPPPPPAPLVKPPQPVVQAEAPAQPAKMEAPPAKAPEAPKAAQPAKAVADTPKVTEPTRSKKRKGPLPLWFAEVLIIGVYAALALGVTKYSNQVSQALDTAGAAVGGAYQKLEALVAKK